MFILAFITSVCTRCLRILMFIDVPDVWTTPSVRNATPKCSLVYLAVPASWTMPPLSLTKLVTIKAARTLVAPAGVYWQGRSQKFVLGV